MPPQDIASNPVTEDAAYEDDPNMPASPPPPHMEVVKD